MAWNSKVQKTVNSSNQKPKCPVSDSNAKKTRSMDEILSVPTMDFQLEEISEEEEIRAVQQTMQSHRMFSEWLSAVHSSANNVKRSGVADRSVHRELIRFQFCKCLIMR